MRNSMYTILWKKLITKKNLPVAIAVDALDRTGLREIDSYSSFLTEQTQ